MKSQYTQDVEFNSGFGALQAPTHLFTVAALCGIQAPAPNRPFRYLDLACGNGLTLTLLADAYPHAEFVGVDINSNHIRKAQDRANGAGLGNVRFIEDDLMNLQPDDYGEFDFCAISGAYSWLDSDRRAACRQFMSSVVRKGGLVYLDYSSQPGIAQVGPLYSALRELGKSFEGKSAEKLKAAALYMDEMRKQGARFFQLHPVAAARLKNILQNPAEDEAHEVFNLQENGFWSSDVISDMEQAEFSYLGNSGLHHNLPSLSSLSSAIPVLENIPVSLQQMLSDITWNVPQRRDVYMRGSNPRPGGDHSGNQSENLAEILVDMPIYALPEALSSKNRKELGKQFGQFDFCSDAANEFCLLALESATFGELFQQLKARDTPLEQSADLVRHFLATRLVSIGARQPNVAKGEAGLEMGSLLNHNILVDDISQEYARPFSSPVAGSRVLLPLKDRLYLWRLVGMDLDEAWNRLEHMQDVFRGTNNEPLSREKFAATIESSLPAFRQHAVPELLRLEILKAR